MTGLGSIIGKPLKAELEFLSAAGGVEARRMSTEFLKDRIHAVAVGKIASGKSFYEEIENGAHCLGSSKLDCDDAMVRWGSCSSQCTFLKLVFQSLFGAWFSFFYDLGYFSLVFSLFLHFRLVVASVCND